jgi:hypothetical protein
MQIETWDDWNEHADGLMNTKENMKDYPEGFVDLLWEEWDG